MVAAAQGGRERACTSRAASPASRRPSAFTARFSARLRPVAGQPAQAVDVVGERQREAAAARPDRRRLDAVRVSPAAHPLADRGRPARRAGRRRCAPSRSRRTPRGRGGPAGRPAAPPRSARGARRRARAGRRPAAARASCPTPPARSGGRRSATRSTRAALRSTPTPSVARAAQRVAARAATGCGASMARRTWCSRTPFTRPSLHRAEHRRRPARAAPGYGVAEREDRLLDRARRPGAASVRRDSLAARPAAAPRGHDRHPAAPVVARPGGRPSRRLAGGAGGTPWPTRSTPQRRASECHCQSRVFSSISRNVPSRGSRLNSVCAIPS